MPNSNDSKDKFQVFNAFLQENAVALKRLKITLSRYFHPVGSSLLLQMNLAFVPEDIRHEFIKAVRTASLPFSSSGHFYWQNSVNIEEEILLKQLYNHLDSFIQNNHKAYVRGAVARLFDNTVLPIEIRFQIADYIRLRDGMDVARANRVTYKTAKAEEKKDLELMRKTQSPERFFSGVIVQPSTTIEQRLEPTSNCTFCTLL